MDTNTPPDNGENDLPAGYRWATEHEMNHPDAIVVPRTFDSTGRPYTQDEADVAVPDTGEQTVEDSTLLERARAATEGMTEDEIVAGMRTGAVDTGLILGAAIESGALVIDNGPFERLYTTDEVRERLGIDAAS